MSHEWVREGMREGREEGDEGRGEMRERGERDGGRGGRWASEERKETLRGGTPDLDQLEERGWMGG